MSKNLKVANDGNSAPEENEENKNRDITGRVPEQGMDSEREVQNPDADPSVGHEWIHELGVSRLNAFRRAGIMKDIQEAIGYLACALEMSPDDHTFLPYRHIDLGMAYTCRYRRLGQVDDLDKSMEHYTRAFALTPDDHPALPDRHTVLGVAYSDRYRRLGQVDDLDKSMEHKLRALALTPDGHPSLYERYATLGVSYTDRYWLLGHTDDLEKSMEHNTRALELTPDDHPDLPLRHANLGVSYSDRYQLLGHIDDLGKSIEYMSRALALTPDGYPSLPDRHAALGVSYEDRYRRLGRVDDLKKSMEHKSRALALTPDSHPSLSDRHAALGVAYTDRYRHLRQVEDLEKAVTHHTRAITLLSHDHPDLPAGYFRRAYTLWLQYQHTRDPSHLAHTLASFRNASQLLTGSPRVRFQNALRWAKHATKNSSLHPLEAYQTTINLLPQFIWLGATTQQRYQDLATTENLAVSAASVAILHSDLNLALEWLEHARCVVWNQALMLRSPIEDLQSSYPDLATRLYTIAEQLHNAGSITSTSRASGSVLGDPEQIGKQRRQLAKEYEDLLAKARTLPGFGDFLRPMKADRLASAARNGPIVVINCHENRCDALLISPGRVNIKHLSLPNFTQNKAKSSRLDLERSLCNKGVRERGFRVIKDLGDNECIARVLQALWDHVVKPVLGFLGYLAKVPAGSLPHITWCPTGALSFLPLHAAGDYNHNHPGSRVFDYVVSSYTPTLTALLASTPSSFCGTTRVLAVGLEHTPGHSSLPGTVAEIECVANHTQATADYSELTGSHAITVDVLDAMDKHDWVHLACHAHQNVDDPTKSGFFLHDGTLDLAAINRRSFKRKGLAFLSACQTATGDEKLPDEAVHLASGMLMAGYPSVIATMWSVMDNDAPFVAEKLYAELMKDGRVGNGEAGRALHKAIRGLREKVGEKDFARWVPYIHIGS